MTKIITFSDSTFHDSDWELIPWMNGNGRTVGAKQEIAGGNPGRFLSIFNRANNASQDGNSNIFGFHLRRGATYNPKIQGAIAAINYSEDSILISSFGEGHATGPALRQNGKFYFTTSKNRLIIPHNSWTHGEKLNLHAHDFRTPENPNEHPDFSANGSIIEFGFFRANTATSDGYGISAGITNWSISIIPSAQPREHDVVLGGDNPPPANAAVLGGLAGVKMRLGRGNLVPSVEQRIAALKDALNYGKPGLDLVIQALKDSSTPVMWAAYSLLLKRPEREVKQELLDYTPYRRMKCISTLTGHSNYVYCLAYSPDGQILASGSQDNTIKIWNLHGQDNRREQHSWHHRRDACATSGAISGATSATRIAPTHTLTGFSGGVHSIAISPDGQMLASCSYNQTISIWNLHDGVLLGILEGHSERVLCVAFSPDGKFLASGSQDNTIKVWNPHNGHLMYTLKGHSGWINHVAFSPDGKILVSGSQDKTIKVWNLQNRVMLRSLSKGHSDRINAVSISPDGKILASCSSDKTLKIWNWQTGKAIKTLKENLEKIWFIAISPLGDIVASAGDNGSIEIWNYSTGELVSTLEGHPDLVRAVAISPNGQNIASASFDGTVKIWGLP